jgi:uncharacterized delta-60 repeat protein
VDVNDDDFLEEVEVQSDGRVLACGTTGSTAPGGDLDFLLVRFTAAGQPDAGFGTNGVVATEVDTNWDGAYGLTVQVDGKIVCAGYYGLINTEVVVVRYLNDLTTAVEHVPGSSAFTLYPNPTRGMVTLGTPGQILSPVLLRDALGRAIAMPVLSGNSFDVSTLAPGLYQVSFENGGAMRTASLVIEGR